MSKEKIIEDQTIRAEKIVLAYNNAVKDIVHVESKDVVLKLEQPQQKNKPNTSKD